MTNSDSLLSQYLKAGDAGELDLLDGYFHQDVIVHDPSGITSIGLDNELETWRAAKSVMPDLHHEVKEVLASDTAIAGRVTVSGTLHGTWAGVSADGRSFEIDQAIFMRLVDGRVREMWTIVDTGSFYRQVGAYPQ